MWSYQDVVTVSKTKILIPIQGYIQDYDVALYGASVISELTQWSGSLTRLVSDLGQVHKKVRLYDTFLGGLRHLPPRM